jgi:hypothetical protein
VERTPQKLTAFWQKLILQNIFVAIKVDYTLTFLDFTFRVIEEGKPHEIAAAFTFGRRFNSRYVYLEKFSGNFPETDLSKLIYYFERHIELDSDTHGPMAMQMINELCGSDAQNGQKLKKLNGFRQAHRIMGCNRRKPYGKSSHGRLIISY